MTKVTVKTAALLTATTGICMVQGFEGVHEAMEIVCGHPVWTHEMGTAIDRAKVLVPAQLPGFPVEATGDNWQQVLADTVAKFGETVEIEPGTDKRTADPITTLQDKLTELGR